MRRIAQLEERLGAHMFEKLPSCYRLTDAGEEGLDFAVQMGASSNQLEARVFGGDQGVRWLLRVTLAPTLATHLLMADFADFACRDGDTIVRRAGELDQPRGRCRDPRRL
jgi:DNA-binding transcriptional LysR family regulator